MDVLRRSMMGWCIAGGWMAMAGTRAFAAPLLQGAELVQALRDGGYTLYMRHATTDNAQKDVQGTDYGTCAKQRNLSEAGRREARAAGEAFSALKLPISEVLASPYCRTRETAKLVFGRAVTAMDVLVGAGADGQPDYGPLLRLVGTAPAPGTIRAIVAHNAPRVAYLKEGECAIVRPTANGFEVATQVEIAGWIPLARMKV
jgi:hypothetical protein